MTDRPTTLTDDRTELGWATVPTPDGLFTLLFDDAQTVYASGWTDAPDYLESLIAPALRGDDLPEFAPGPAADAVLAYYEGELDAPSRIAVHQSAGPFIEDCWSRLREVTPGSSVTYAQLAERAGRPTAVRGAAQCCVRNAANLFVPCHRVVRSDGTLGGYRYGLELKAALLDREARSWDVAV